MPHKKQPTASHAYSEERARPRVRRGITWRLVALWCLLPVACMISALHVSAAAAVTQVQRIDISPLILRIGGNPKTVRIDDVAHDGRAAVGSFSNPPDKLEGRRFFVYTKTGGMQEIEDLHRRPVDSLRVSGNGAVIWGTYYDYRHGTYAGVFRWTLEGGLRELGSFGRHGMKITASSFDGQFVAGSFRPSPGEPVFHAFRYSETRGFEDLGAMGAKSAIPHAISGDSLWIAGHLQYQDERVAHGFLRSPSTGVHPIPAYLGDPTFASGVSNDGSVVVGTYCHGGVDFEPCTHAPFVYTEKAGVQPIPEISGCSIVRIVASPDGMRIGGACMDSDFDSYIFTGAFSR
jgi:hypothetical protein